MNFSHDKQPGKNFTGIIVVIVIHVLVGWAAVTGLGTRIVTKMADVVETTIVEEAKPLPPPDVPPPPPPPELKAPPPPFMPPVEVNVQQPPPPNTVTSVTREPPPNTELAPPAKPVVAPPGPAAPKGISSEAVADFSTCSTPEYPRDAKAAEETGVTTMRYKIAADGGVMASQVIKSSGSRSLDKAALNAISKCRFKPKMVDGVPMESSKDMQYIWKLD
jgi:protein TonB